jgi:uncharacterized protein (TIGR02145 family)
MRRLILIIVILGFIYNTTAQQTGTFTDPRDGKIYKTVKIGTQTWMAENLAYKPSSGKYWLSPNNYYYYDWATAKSVAPAGWHLPSQAEWKALIDFIGGSSLALPEKFKTIGFNFEDLGYYELNSIDEFNWEGYFWSSTEENVKRAWSICQSSDEEVEGTLITLESMNKTLGLNIRCVKD